jgi:glycerol-3-phosphate cytidylyltransferase-like family protein
MNPRSWLRRLSQPCCLLPGHVHIINEARKLGSVVIGILSDEAVTAYRGKPSVPFEGRAAIFRAVKGVAAVVAQYQCVLSFLLLRPRLC